MAGPTFHELRAAARAHQKPNFDADLIVGNARSQVEAAPPDWTQDALRSVPRPPVFRGPIGAIDGYPEDGKNAWRASNDAVIVAAVNRHNAERNLFPGDAEFMTPQLMKSWMMVESGSSADRAAFERDPFQINNAGDWKRTGADKVRILGLRQDQVMTPETSAEAALKWLAHRGRLHRDENNEVRRGPFWTPYEALRNYNANRDYGNRDKSNPSNRHDNRYAGRILGRIRD